MGCSIMVLQVTTPRSYFEMIGLKTLSALRFAPRGSCVRIAREAMMQWS